MSGTLGATRRKVRYHLRDRDPAKYAFATPVVDAAIASSLNAVAGRLRLGHDWSIGAIALVALTDTYALPGTAQYAQVLALRKQSDGLEIELVTRAVFEDLRAGSVAATGGGSPQYGTLWETAAQALKLQLWPNPAKADSLDLLRGTRPEALTTDASTIALDDDGLEALAYAAAATLGGTASEDVLASLGLSPGVAGVYEAAGREAERSSRLRRSRFTANGATRRKRRW